MNLSIFRYMLIITIMSFFTTTLFCQQPLERKFENNFLKHYTSNHESEHDSILTRFSKLIFDGGKEFHLSARPKNTNKLWYIMMKTEKMIYDYECDTIKLSRYFALIDSTHSKVLSRKERKEVNRYGYRRILNRIIAKNLTNCKKSTSITSIYKDCPDPQIKLDSIITKSNETIYEIKINLLGCINMPIEFRGYHSGSYLGPEVYYERLANCISYNWLNGDLGMSRDDISLTISGFTDRISVNAKDGGVKMLDNEGKNWEINSTEFISLTQTNTYNFVSMEGEGKKEKIRTISGSIMNNEELGLARAFLAIKQFSKITNNSIKVFSQQLDGEGPEFRKVMISIRFNKKLVKNRASLIKTIYGVCN